MSDNRPGAPGSDASDNQRDPDADNHHDQPGESTAENGEFSEESAPVSGGLRELLESPPKALNEQTAAAFLPIPRHQVIPLDGRPDIMVASGEVWGAIQGDIAADVLDAQLRSDIAGAYSLATMRAYRTDWRDWAAWAATHGKPALPANPRDLRDYLVDLASTLKVATLRRRLAAIARAHKMAGYQLDRMAPAVYHAMRAIARKKGVAAEGRAPLMTADVLKMLRHVRTGLAGLRDRALILVGFAGGLRRSELVALQVNDLDWRRDGVAVRIRRSKTDQEGKGQEILLAWGKRESSCPVRALRRWIDNAGLAAGPIFRHIEAGRPRPEPLSDRAVYELVKRLAQKAGLDPARLGAHSLRAGHVTQALENGADPLAAKRQLRHSKLDTTLGYDRRKDFKGSTSGKLGL